jgi:hypothetical protein
MDLKVFGKWLYLIGLLVAILAALITALDFEWLSWVLMIVGVLVGIFYTDPKKVKGFVLRYVGLYYVHDALGAFPGIGEYLTGIFYAVLTFLGPILLTTLVVWFVKKYFMK